MARLPRESVIAVLRDTQTSVGQVYHALKSRLDKVISRRPFQPEWFCFHLLFRNHLDLPVEGVFGKTKTFQMSLLALTCSVEKEKVGMVTLSSLLTLRCHSDFSFRQTAC